MRAAQLDEYGGRLALCDVPDPQVRDAHDVVVRVGGAGLCRTDLHILDGQLSGFFDVQLPYTLGHETAGWVEEVGPEVGNVRAGDAVLLHPEATCGACRPCRDGRDMYCSDSRSPGFNVDGGFAEFVLVNDRTLVPLTPDQDPVAVAPLADAGLAAYRAVRKAAPALGPGTRVAVLGCGGLGHLAIQLLHALTPARVLAVDVAEGGRALAAAVGADDVIEGGADAADAVLAATHGAGVDAVFDFVGDGGTPQQALGMLAKGGTYHVVGYGGTLSVPTMLLVGQELTIAGSCVGTYTELAELVALSAQGRLHLETQTFALEEIDRAVDALRAGRVRGRAVLTP
jgi:NAD+-dependent secondary alcohol dehydrogenase Adh1